MAGTEAVTEAGTEAPEEISEEGRAVLQTNTAANARFVRRSRTVLGITAVLWGVFAVVLVRLLRTFRRSKGRGPDT